MQPTSENNTPTVEAQAAKTLPFVKGMLPPSDLPKPPKIGSIPVGRNVVPINAPAAEAATADSEWDAWLTACKTTFGALKAAKESLKHAENISRAKILADGVNDAWRQMQSAGKEVVQ